MQRSTFTYTNSRKHCLHCVEYKPPAGTRPKAALFLHHGIAEHIGRYDAVFSHWARDHALCVYGYDCHGHGRSDPKHADDRIYIHNFGDLVDDMTDFVAHVGAERGLPAGLPRVVGGHSMGGLVAAHAVLRLAQKKKKGAATAAAAAAAAADDRATENAAAAAASAPSSSASSPLTGAAAAAAAAAASAGGEQEDALATTESTGVAGLVLHSAALDVVWTPVLRALAAVGALLALALPRARLVPAVKPEAMHPDPAVVRGYLDDPHVVVGNTRARTANEVLKGFKGLAGKEGLFALPVFAVHGSDDTTTSLAAVRAFVDKAGRAGKAHAPGGVVAPGAGARLREVEGGYHELMAAPGEAEREAEEVAAWVEGLPAGDP